jgi:hypothetical protein
MTFMGMLCDGPKTGVEAGDDAGAAARAEDCAGWGGFFAEAIGAEDAQAVGDWDVDRGLLLLEHCGDALCEFGADASAGALDVLLMNRAGEGCGDCPPCAATDAEERGKHPKGAKADAG